MTDPAEYGGPGPRGPARPGPGTRGPEDPRRRRATTAVAASALLGLLGAAAMVLSSSSAAFSSSTENVGSSISTGDVRLRDDDRGAALFTVRGLAPGRSVAECLTVDYDGSLDAAEVRLHAAPGVVDPDGLAASLGLTVDVGTPTSTCDAFRTATSARSTLADFRAARTGWADGLTVWDPAGPGESRAVRFTVGLDAGVGDEAQDRTVSDLGFVFEVRP